LFDFSILVSLDLFRQISKSKEWSRWFCDTSLLIDCPDTTYYCYNLVHWLHKCL